MPGIAAFPAFRLGIVQDGPCLLPVEELASRFGLTVQSAGATLAAGGFALSRQGQPVAYEGATNGLIFFGQANRSIDSAETVYLLELGDGLALEGEDHAADGVEAAVSPVSLLPYTQHLETNGWCSIILDSRAEVGWMVWQYLNRNGTYSYSCPAPGYPASGGTVTLRIGLRSLHPEDYVDQHAFNVAWNGQSLGTASWGGQTSFVWQGALPAGTVPGPQGGTLTLRETTDTTAGRGGLEWIELLYERPGLAGSGLVLWEAGSTNPVVLTEFPGEPVSVWDVTKADSPVRLEGVGTIPRDGGYACGFKPFPGRRYAAFCPAGLSRSVSWRPDESADLAAATNVADWVVITPPRALADFSSGAQWLADFRSAQGLRTRIVTAEAIADTFGGGILSTGAIRRFVQATAGWTVRPDSLVLMGYGNVDYRRESVLSKCLIPTPAVSIVFKVGDRMGEIVSADSLYGDDNRDGVPEVVIGRIPAQTEEELVEALAKIARFEAAAAGKGTALFSSDDPTNGLPPGMNLHLISDAAAADAAAGGFTPVKVYVPAAPKPTSSVIRPGIMAALAGGPSFYLHLGHGDAGQIGWGSVGNGILVNYLLGNVQAWAWPVIGLFPSCQINRFHHPSYPDTFCLEAWRYPEAGFAAIWAPSCKVEADDGVLLAREMVKAWAGDSPLRLAGAVRLAASRSRGRLLMPSILPCVTLLGDPATVIRLGRNARDVPESWLREKGLADPNEGEADADGDSFPAWAEYYRATDPLDGTDHPLRIDRIAPASGRIALRFVSGPGSRYRILRKSGLGAGQAWEPVSFALSAEGSWLLPGEWLTAGDMETTVFVPADGGAQFFKVEAYP